MKTLRKAVRVCRGVARRAVNMLRLVPRLLARGETGRAARAARKGMRLLNAGEFQAALDTIRKALASWPDDPLLLSCETRALLGLEQPHEAMHALHRLEQVTPKLGRIDALRRDVYHANLNRAREQDTPQEGLRVARDAVRNWPRAPAFCRQEIFFLGELGQRDAAAERTRNLQSLGKVAEEALALVHDTMHHRMNQHGRDGNWEIAAATWFDLARLFPKRLRAARFVVDACLAAQAIRRRDGAPEQDRSPEIDMLDRLYDAAIAGRADDIRALIVKALAADPPGDWLAQYLGQFHREMDEHTATCALRAVGQALVGLTPAQIEALYTDHLDMGREIAAAFEPDLASGFLELLTPVLVRDDGLSRWEKMKRGQYEGYAPNNLNKTARACLDLARIEDFESSLACARESQAVWPGNPRLIRPEARALMRLGYPQEAMQVLKRLEAIEPDLGVIDVLRRAIYRANISHTREQGAPEKGLQLTRAALEIWPTSEEFRRAEIRFLVWLGDSDAALERAGALQEAGEPAEQVTKLVHDALRHRQTWLGEHGDYEAAISVWFEQARMLPELPRTPNRFVDNCLAAQAARREVGVPEQGRSPEIDLLDRLYDAAVAGQVDATGAAIREVLVTLTPNDWMARYLRMFHREMEEETSIAAFQTVGKALLGLDNAQIETLFQGHPSEAMELIANFGRGQITNQNPDMALNLADMVLRVLGPSVQAYSLRARVNFQTEHFQESQDDIARALALDPYAVPALQTELSLLATSGRHDEAARRLAELKASGQLDNIRLAQLAARGQRSKEALALFREAMRVEPNNRGIATAYLKFCYSYGYWGHCIARFEQTPALKTGHPRIAQDVYELAKAAGTPAQEIQANPDNFRASPVALNLAADAPPSSLPAPAIQPTGSAPEGKRAAIVIGSLGPGGAERQCSVLVRTIARDPAAYGISDLKLFCTNLSQSPKHRFLLDQVREAGIEPVEYFSRDRSAELTPDPLRHMLPRSRGQVMVQLRSALQDYRPDVVHGILDETIINACLATLHMGGTRFVGRWGSLPPGASRQVSQRANDNVQYLQGAYRILMARHPNAAFYSNATESARAYETWLGQPEHAFSTIYNGVEADKLIYDPAARTAIRAELGIDDDTIVIGTAFRFTEEKRPFKWLDMARAVAARANRKVAFIMLGNGPLWLPSQKYAADTGTRDVHFVGRQSDIHRWWSAMDIGLMTSSVEGISNTVIEAQLLGRPVVAFDVGGMNEAIQAGLTGELLTEGDDPGMVDRLTALVENPAHLHSMSQAATAFVLERFSADTLARNTTALY